jgi:ornithine racemase
VIDVADVSFNTSIATIKTLNQEAKRQGKVHKIIIMIELGDLREGVLGEELVEFYEKVFQLEHIEVIGLGTNLNCLNGILPSQDKLIQLSLYRQLINAKFNSNIKWVSAGASITIPLISIKQVPKGCNHFRVGETLFFGNDIYNHTPAKGMKQDVFTVNASIIEIRDKPMFAQGEQGFNMEGKQPEMDETMMGVVSTRAIVDLGLLDVDWRHIKPVDDNIKIIGASSDMLVLDLKENTKNLKLGDKITFIPNYNAVLMLMNSNYVEKKVVD